MYMPGDIASKEFNIVHKGLNEYEVREYLTELSNELEKMREEKAMLQKMIDDKDENINRFRAVENTINESIIHAQRTGEEIKAAAGMQADVIIKDAKNHAEMIVNDALQQSREISFKTEDMKRQSKIFRARFKMLVEAQLDLLKNEDWDHLLNYDLETKPIEQTTQDDVNSN